MGDVCNEKYIKVEQNKTKTKKLNWNKKELWMKYERMLDETD